MLTVTYLSIASIPVEYLNLGWTFVKMDSNQCWRYWLKILAV